MLFSQKQADRLSLRQGGKRVMNAAPSMRTLPPYLLLLIVAFGAPSLVHASCENFSASLERINTEEKENYKKARKRHVQENCGHESQSWIGGAAGRRRFVYLNCKMRTQNSEQFKKDWSRRADIWRARREKVEAERLLLGCVN